MPYKSVIEFLQQAKEKTSLKVSVAQAADEKTLKVAAMAKEQGLADFILIGNEAEIKEGCKSLAVDETWFRIIDAENHQKCAAIAIELIKNNEASLPMKGHLHTALFIKAALNSETGIRGKGLISEITVTDKPETEGVQLITDCALSINPDVLQKKQIIENAVGIAVKLGVEMPKVACVTALEEVNLDMQDTVDAAILSKMADRGQIRGAIVDGPFALDNAVSPTAASHKGVNSPVAGNADILLMSDIRMGNVLHKSITFYAKRPAAVIVAGAQAPILMNSRSDKVEDKLLSIALACLTV